MDNGQSGGSWRELGRHLSTTLVLAGGVLMGAVTIYVVASLLPTAVGELGGERWYSWNTTAFLVAQVVATMVVGWALSRYGKVGAYLIGFGVFASGSLVCAVGPVMAVLLLGRGVQGLGAGLLTGLGFAVVHSALPPHLWARGSAVISAMFGVGNFVGPALGGLFAQFGSWRSAFVVLAVAAVAMAVVVPRALPRGERSRAVTPVPVRSLVLVVAAVGAVSVAGIVSGSAARLGVVVLGLVLVVAFLAADKRAAVRVLPQATYQAGSSLRWVYLTIAILASGVAVETFLPLFSQELGGLPPVAAGFFAATLSFGWSAGQIVSASARRERMIRRLRTTGPAVLAAGLAVLALLQHPSTFAVLAWLPVLLVAGSGIGMAMPHLSVAAMAGDPGEGEKAAAAIATVLTMSTAFGSAIAGVLVNQGGDWVVASAVVSALGITAARGIRHPMDKSVVDGENTGYSNV